MFRKTFQKLGLIGRKFAVVLLRLYRYLISPVLGPRCRFFPSCSTYAEIAIGRFGIIKGGWLSLKRLAKCHRWHSGGYDPVPEKKREE